MNQTAWVVFGGVAMAAIAAALYVFGGGTPKVITESATPAPEASVVITDTSTTTAKDITQSPPKNMEQETETPVIAIMHTTMGDVTLMLYPHHAPKTVENFLKLSKEGFYNGVRFHRVIKDFMIQTGDPLSKDDTQMARWGQGGPDYKFADEINPHKLVRGSLAMANAGPNTNGSQFFIVTKDSTPWLDGKHTNFGEVTSGMDVVMKIDGVAVAPGDRPLTPVTITSIDIK